MATNASVNVMGSIRTKDIKDTANRIYATDPEKYGDFEKNKKSLNELKIFSNKKMKNRVAGYMVRVVSNNKRKK